MARAAGVGKLSTRIMTRGSRMAGLAGGGGFIMIHRANGYPQRRVVARSAVV